MKKSGVGFATIVSLGALLAACGGSDSAAIPGGDSDAGDSASAGDSALVDETAADTSTADSSSIDSERPDTSSVDSDAIDDTSVDGAADDSSLADDTFADDTFADDTFADDTSAADTLVADSRTDALADSSVLDSSVLDSSVLDSSVLDSSVVDSGPADAGCGTLVLGTAGHVYVDKSAPPGGNGTLACPFNTIKAATGFVVALGSRLTIHVRGGSPQVVYEEASPIVLGYRTTLTSSYPGAPSGSLAAKIVAAGTCPVGNSAPCAVGVSLDSRLEGFTVGVPAAATATNGVVTSSERGPRPVVTDVVVTDTTASGLLVQGSAQIGPAVRSLRNAKSGLLASLPASASAAPAIYIQEQATITATPPAPTTFSNEFSDNGESGINISGAAWVMIRATRADRNQRGVLLSTTTTGSNLEVMAVSASNNKEAGFSANVGGYLDIAGSSLNAFDDNGFAGLYLAAASTASFGGGSVSRNGSSGVLVFSTMTRLVSITGLVARGNGKTYASAAGIDVQSNAASLTLRGSTLLGNPIGLRFRQGAANVLDVGKGTTAGNNTFQAAVGGAPSTANNTRAGLCIEGSGVAGSQAAYGNAWAACPPNQVAGTSGFEPCFLLPVKAGVDVAYIPAVSGSGAPVAVGGACSIGTP